MTIKEYAKSLDGRECGYRIFTSKEIQTAKDNGWVIVTGDSDDLREVQGVFEDERVCYDGGEILFSKDRVYNGEDDLSAFPNRIEAFWCDSAALDEKGNVIPWTYKTDIPHETFMVYEDGEPYCRGIVFSVEDLK